jgi:hypothetical protein
MEKGKNAVVQGLVSYQLVPRGTDGTQKITGSKLLQHMCHHRVTEHGEVSATISPALAVEMTEQQRSIIKPTERELALHAIMQETGGTGRARKMAKRRTNTLGEINRECVVANDPVRVKKLRSHLQLADSIDHMKRISNENNAQKQLKEDKVLAARAPTATRKLAAVYDGSCITAAMLEKLTVNDLIAVALVEFHIRIKQGKGGKKGVVSSFKAAADKYGWKPQCHPAPSADESAPAEAPPVDSGRSPDDATAVVLEDPTLLGDGLILFFFFFEWRDADANMHMLYTF